MEPEASSLTTVPSPVDELNDEGTLVGLMLLSFHCSFTLIWLTSYIWFLQS
jgi:hypothetical protein